MSLKNRIHRPWRESLGDKAALWRGGLHGFERETFRLSGNGLPAASTHQELFGPASRTPLESAGQSAAQIDRFRGSEAEKARLRRLLPTALTLDFSDQQIELVSSPRSDIAAAEADISLLLRFVAGELDRYAGAELLWAYPQPPLFSETDLSAIRVADFGTEPDARYKEQYRQQLVLRYGKAKQSWTSVHYNFSLDKRLFEDVSLSSCDTYVHLGRNLWRRFWLLELLFGCTPRVSDFYVRQVQQHFAAGRVSLAKPPWLAGALHSHFAYGYRSSEQQMQFLDYSDSCAYWQSIERITQTESAFFRRLQQSGKSLSSSKLIQDSRELYMPFRLKQLHVHGNESWQKEGCLVDYLELRILDIDPHFDARHYSGIYLPSIYLSHLLLLYCALLEAPPLEHEELLRCARREQYVLSRGQDLKGLPPAWQEEARTLLGELGELAGLLGLPQQYGAVLDDSMEALQHNALRSRLMSQRLSEQEETAAAGREAMLAHSRAWTHFLQQAGGREAEHLGEKGT